MGRWGRRRRGGRGWGWDSYERTTPREVKGGIRAQSKHGVFGENWWAKRWIAVLEGWGIGTRLGRGKRYARSGQVVSIDVGRGKVSAKVQGSRPLPYTVEISVKALAAADWKRVARGLASQARFAAKLLAGEMPEEIESLFEGEGIALFPSRSKDVTTSCSCPDLSNPCKHVAAVYYLIGEELDRDPFLIFKLRGKSREELVAMLDEVPRARAAPATKPAAKSAVKSRAEPAEPVAGAELLPADPEAFWVGRAIPADLLGEVRLPPVAAAPARRLGRFPFWRGSEPFLETLEPLYIRASTRALELLAGGDSDEE